MWDKKFPDFRCRNLLIKIMQNDHMFQQDIRIIRLNYTLSQSYSAFSTNNLYKMIALSWEREKLVIFFRMLFTIYRIIFWFGIFITAIML